MDNKTSFILIISMFFILFALIASISDKQLIQNLTNLAPDAGAPHPFGTSERVIGETYWANNSEIDLYIFSHCNVAGQICEVFVNNSNITVYWDSKMPIGQADEIFTSAQVNIPKGTNYSVSISNNHHYEWREYLRK